jgi:protein-tyrosine-phosphatase
MLTVDHILFVCTGNTCRSPMAQALFNQLAARHQLPVQALSAGVSATTGTPISDQTKAILRNRGVTEALFSTELSQEILNRSSVILTMTLNHKRLVIQRYPSAIDKTFTLREYVESDPEVLAVIAERASLYSDMHLKKALNQEITKEEINQLAQLEHKLPHDDIADPFGGDYHEYEHCANEIEGCILKLISKLRKDQ